MINTLNNVLFVLIWTSLFILINGAVTIITVTTLYYLDEFARAHVVRAEMSLAYTVSQVILIAPFSWLPGLEPETGYPFSLGTRLKQCYPSRAPSSGACERLGWRIQLVVNQACLAVLRCLTSPKMRFVHVLSVSKLVGWYWSNKGLASQRSGEYHLSIKYYQKALTYNPGSVDIWYNLGYSYLENKQYVTAIECFRTVARLDVDREYDVLFCITKCAA